MERRNFINKTLLASTAFMATGSLYAKQSGTPKNIYELRVYELHWNQNALEEYFVKALIPFLNRSGVKHVGVFAELSKSEPVKRYVLIPYTSFENYINTIQQEKTDDAFLKASAFYNGIPQDQAAYTRYDSSLMVAFDGLPTLVVPENSNRIFELRTYEGYSEDAVRRKIKMFNEAEFSIFDRAKLHPVFFGEVIVGKNQPCITYMITFKNMAERDANWKAFGADAEWQKISKDEAYTNTVSKIHKVFLEPLPCSQI